MKGRVLRLTILALALGVVFPAQVVGQCESWTPMSTAGAPSPREAAASVWTGEEFIVWGGYCDYLGPPYFLNDGARYNPETDAWTPMSMVDAPTARVYHTIVWTGEEAIVWAGYTNTGARYNPKTDTWSPMTTVNAPDGRIFHSAIWTGEEMIVWGGGDNSTLGFDTGGRYDPKTDTWVPTSTANAPSPREDHSAVWTGKEMIVWGGRGSTGLPYPYNVEKYDSGGRYDPKTDTWTPTSTLNAPKRRSLHKVVWTGNEMLVFGGFYSEWIDGIGWLWEYLNTGGRYNPETDTWTPTAVPIVETAVGDTITAENNDNSEVISYLSPSFTLPLDGSVDTVLVLGWNMICVKERLEAPDGTMMLLKNFNETAPNNYYDVTDFYLTHGPGEYRYWLYEWDWGLCPDPVTVTPEMEVAAVPLARRGHAALWTGSEMLVWGGSIGNNLLSRTGARYDRVTDSWTQILRSGAPSERTGDYAAWTGEAMIVWGGYGPGGSNFQVDGGLYRPYCRADWQNPAGTPDGGLWTQGGAPLEVFDAGADAVTVTWSAACNSLDSSVMVGDLNALSGGYSHESYVCTDEGGDAQETISPAGNSLYFLVVPHNGVVEGSYGRDSAGAERPASTLACYPQSVGACSSSDLYCVRVLPPSGSPCEPAGDMTFRLEQSGTEAMVTLFIGEPQCFADPGSQPVLTGTIDPATGDFTVSGSDDAISQEWGCGADLNPIVMTGNLITMTGTLDNFFDACGCTLQITWDSSVTGNHWCTPATVSGCN